MPSAIAYPSGVSQLTLEAKRFEGPLPPPTDLKQYDDVSPGFAERIRGMQSKIIGRGQVFGFILSFTIILGGISLIMFDKPTSGFVSILTGIATVAGPFFYGVHREKKQK